MYERRSLSLVRVGSELGQRRRIREYRSPQTVQREGCRSYLVASSGPTCREVAPASRRQCGYSFIYPSGSLPQMIQSKISQATFIRYCFDYLKNFSILSPSIRPFNKSSKPGALYSFILLAQHGWPTSRSRGNVARSGHDLIRC